MAQMSPITEYRMTDHAWFEMERGSDTVDAGDACGPGGLESTFAAEHLVRRAMLFATSSEQVRTAAIGLGG